MEKLPSTEHQRRQNPHENEYWQHFQQQGDGTGVSRIAGPPRLLSPKNREFGGKCCKFGENYAARSNVSFRSFCSLATCVLNLMHGKMVEKASDTSPMRINIAFLARRHYKHVPGTFVFPFFNIVFVYKTLHQFFDRGWLQTEFTLYVG